MELVMFGYYFNSWLYLKEVTDSRACCLQLKRPGAYVTDVDVLSAVLHLFCGPWGNADEVGDSFE